MMKLINGEMSEYFSDNLENAWLSAVGTLFVHGRKETRYILDNAATVLMSAYLAVGFRPVL